MLDNIVNFSLKNKTLITFLCFLLIISGLTSWYMLPKEAYPDVGDTQVMVITKYPGRAAEEVELLVTRPLERELNSIIKVVARRSKSIFGLSVIQLVFKDDVNDYFARQLVLEKMSQANLPEGAIAELAPLTGPVGEIFRYVLKSDSGHDAMDLRTIQDWVVIPNLLQTPGVADVFNFGGLLKQYNVITTPDKLKSYGLSLEDIIEALRNNNINTGGNILTQGDQGFAVRAVGAITSTRDIENTQVSAVNGVPILIKNISNVEIQPAPQSGILGISTKDGGDISFSSEQSIQGIIAMTRGEETGKVLHEVKDKIEQINANELPKGVRIEGTYDRGELVNYTIRTVSMTLFEGISIVCIILYLFLRSFWSSIAVAITIPLSMLFAFTFMKLSGVPANLLSLGAIDFGIIVDASVVMVENIIRHFSEKKEQLSPDEITGIAAKEVIYEIFFSIVIIIIAYLPIFSFERVEGKLFRPMATTLSFAILGSMLLSLTVVPAMMSLVLKYKGHSLGNKNAFYDRMEIRYSKLIKKLLQNPKRTIRYSTAIIATIIFLGGSMIGTEFLPELDEGAVNVRCLLPVGYSLQSAAKLVPQIKNKIISYDEVDTVITQLGRNDDGTDPYGPNRVEVLVNLKDYKKWKSGLSKKDLLANIREDLQRSFPGVKFIYSQPIMDNVTEAVTGSVSDLAILVTGTNLTEMRQLAKKIIEMIKNIQGASDVGIEQEEPQDQLKIIINREIAARYKLEVSDIQTLVESAIGGKEVSTLYSETGEQFGIVVRYSGAYRRDIQQVRNLIVSSQTGGSVPLSEVAKVEFHPGETIIQRQNGKRQISVRVNIRNRDQGGFVKEAKKIVANGIDLPSGYKIEWGGQYENLERARNKLMIVIPLSVLLIYGLLYLHYRTNRESLIAMSCIPFSLSGGILALLVRGYHFNVSSGVGFISLFGIATMTGVLFVSRVKHLKHELPFDDAVLKAAITQFRPRLMTISLALLGLIPATLAKGVGSDIQRPLATVILGGLTTELVLSLLVLPSVYIQINKLAIGFRSKKTSGVLLQR